MYLNKDDSTAFRYIYLRSYISYIHPYRHHRTLQSEKKNSLIKSLPSISAVTFYLCA